jgi:hypothetical protein
MTEIEAFEVPDKARRRPDLVISVTEFAANPVEKPFARVSLRNGISSAGRQIPWHQT